MKERPSVVKKNSQYIHSYLLNIILLCDVACRQISDPVDGDYANVLNGPQEILNDNETPPFFAGTYFEGDEVSPDS